MSLKKSMQESCSSVKATLIIGSIATLTVIIPFGIFWTLDQIGIGELEKVRTPARVVPTSTVHVPEGDIGRAIRTATSAVEWIERNADGIARCVGRGNLDWDLYSTRLEVVAIILQEAGHDWSDGSMDSYSVYEVQRAVDGALQINSEIRSKCDIS